MKLALVMFFACVVHADWVVENAAGRAVGFEGPETFVLAPGQRLRVETLGYYFLYGLPRLSGGESELTAAHGDTWRVTGWTMSDDFYWIEAVLIETAQDFRARWHLIGGLVVGGPLVLWATVSLLRLFRRTVEVSI